MTQEYLDELVDCFLCNLPTRSGRHRADIDVFQVVFDYDFSLREDICGSYGGVEFETWNEVTDERIDIINVLLPNGDNDRSLAKRFQNAINVRYA